MQVKRQANQQYPGNQCNSFLINAMHFSWPHRQQKDLHAKDKDLDPIIPGPL